MATVNKVFLIGNLTRDPELRYTPNGSAVCEFGIAINRVFTSNNERKEETCFIDVNAWGRQAETCSKYLQKGSSVCIEGRLHLDQWQDRETGKPRSKLKVVAERTQFLGAPKRNHQHDNGGGYGDSPRNGYDNGGANTQYPTPHQHASHSGILNSESAPTSDIGTAPRNPMAPPSGQTPPSPMGVSGAAPIAPAGPVGTEDDIPF